MWLVACDVRTRPMMGEAESGEGDEGLGPHLCCRAGWVE